MYNRSETFHPSNEFIRNYKHKDILNKYKQISEERLMKSNTLLELYDTLQGLEIRLEQIKIKNKNEGKNKKNK